MNWQSVRLWWRAFRSRASLLRLLEALGVLWLLVEATTFFHAPLGEWFRGVWWLFPILGIAVAAKSAWPRLRVSSVLSNRDVRITVAVTDIFDEEGDVVISSNSTFDTDIQAGVISEKSIQGQFTRKHLSSVAALDALLKTQLTGLPFEELDARKGKQKRYDIGTVCRIDTNGPTAYMVAICHMNPHGNAEGSIQYLQDALPLIWEFIREKGRKEKVRIPVLGTGFSRISERREMIIKDIIRSFTASCAEATFSDELIICIDPADFTKHAIDLDEIGEFLTFQCRYVDFSGTMKRGLGTEV